MKQRLTGLCVAVALALTLLMPVAGRAGGAPNGTGAIDMTEFTFARAGDGSGRVVCRYPEDTDERLRGAWEQTVGAYRLFRVFKLEGTEISAELDFNMAPHFTLIEIDEDGVERDERNTVDVSEAMNRTLSPEPPSVEDLDDEPVRFVLEEDSGTDGGGAIVRLSFSEDISGWAAEDEFGLSGLYLPVRLRMGDREVVNYISLRSILDSDGPEGAKVAIQTEDNSFTFPAPAGQWWNSVAWEEGAVFVSVQGENRAISTYRLTLGGEDAPAASPAPTDTPDATDATPEPDPTPESTGDSPALTPDANDTPDPAVTDGEPPEQTEAPLELEFDYLRTDEGEIVKDTLGELRDKLRNGFMQRLPAEGEEGDAPSYQRVVKLASGGSPLSLICDGESVINTGEGWVVTDDEFALKWDAGSSADRYLVLVKREDEPGIGCAYSGADTSFSGLATSLEPGGEYEVAVWGIVEGAGGVDEAQLSDTIRIIKKSEQVSIDPDGFNFQEQERGEDGERFIGESVRLNWDEQEGIAGYMVTVAAQGEAVLTDALDGDADQYTWDTSDTVVKYESGEYVLSISAEVEGGESLPVFSKSYQLKDILTGAPAHDISIVDEQTSLPVTGEEGDNVLAWIRGAQPGRAYTLTAVGGEDSIRVLALAGESDRPVIELQRLPNSFSLSWSFSGAQVRAYLVRIRDEGGVSHIIELSGDADRCEIPASYLEREGLCYVSLWALGEGGPVNEWYASDEIEIEGWSYAPAEATPAALRVELPAGEGGEIELEIGEPFLIAWEAPAGAYRALTVRRDGEAMVDEFALEDEGRFLWGPDVWDRQDWEAGSYVLSLAPQDEDAPEVQPVRVAFTERAPEVRYRYTLAGLESGEPVSGGVAFGDELADIKQGGSYLLTIDELVAGEPSEVQSLVLKLQPGEGGQPALDLAGAADENGVHTLAGESFELQWNYPSASADTLYIIWSVDGEGRRSCLYAGGDARGVSLPTEPFESGEEYELTLWAVAGGAEVREVMCSAPLVVTLGPSGTAATFSVDYAVPEGGVWYVGEPITISWEPQDGAESYLVRYVEPDGRSVEMPVGEVLSYVWDTGSLSAGSYTLRVGAALPDGSEQDTIWSEKAEFELVETFEIGRPNVLSIGGAEPDSEGVLNAYGESLELAWEQQQGVASYKIFIDSGTGRLELPGDFEGSSAVIPLDDLAYDREYLLLLVAMPQDGGEERAEAAELRLVRRARGHSIPLFNSFGGGAMALLIINLALIVVVLLLVRSRLRAQRARFVDGNKRTKK